MTELISDCPRCKSSHVTFDLLSAHVTHIEHGWQRWFEAFCVCRGCKRSTVFILSQTVYEEGKLISNGLANIVGVANHHVGVEGYISIKDISSISPPDHLPENIVTAFKEGATCMSVACHNAAGTMFRLCVDLATRAMLPMASEGEPSRAVRRNLGLRLPWLLDNKILPESLRDLSLCIKDDGNDGAHEGTLGKGDAEDILDFTYALLDRIYTEPRKLELAKERRDARKAKA